jgi:hypothetical protein
VLRYAKPSAEPLDDMRAVSFLRGAMDMARSLVASLVRMMEPDVQERAFGPPGVEGNAEGIKHLATRWNSVYEELVN